MSRAVFKFDPDFFPASPNCRKKKAEVQDRVVKKTSLSKFQVPSFAKNKVGRAKGVGRRVLQKT